MNNCGAFIPRQHIKKQLNHFANKGPSSQSDGFSSSHVQMWELNHEEGWVLKNWYFWTLVFEKTLESPLDCKKITPVNSKENQPWIFIGRTDAEAEAPILWPSDVKSPALWKRPWCWKTLKAGGEDDRGWDGWMTSLTQWTWVLANSRRQWRTGKPGMLQSMGVTKSLTLLSDWTATNESRLRKIFKTLDLYTLLWD